MPTTLPNYKVILFFLWEISRVLVFCQIYVSVSFNRANSDEWNLPIYRGHFFFPCNLLNGPRPVSFPKMPGSGINHWDSKRSSSCLTSLHAYLKPSQDTWLSIFFWKSCGYGDRAYVLSFLWFFHICYWSTISRFMVECTLSCTNECKFVLKNPYPLTWSFSCLAKTNT